MNAKLINKRIQELKEENYKIAPQNLPRFKNPYLLKSDTEVLNDILNRKPDKSDTAQNPPIGGLQPPTSAPTSAPTSTPTSAPTHGNLRGSGTPAPTTTPTPAPAPAPTTAPTRGNLRGSETPAPVPPMPTDETHHNDETRAQHANHTAHTQQQSETSGAGQTENDDSQKTPTVGDDTSAQLDNNNNHPLSRPNANQSNTTEDNPFGNRQGETTDLEDAANNPDKTTEDAEDDIVRDDEGYEIFPPNSNKSWMRRADGSRDKVVFSPSDSPNREYEVTTAVNDLNNGDTFYLDGTVYGKGSTTGNKMMTNPDGVLDSNGNIPNYLGLNAEERGSDLTSWRGKPLTQIVKSPNGVNYYYGPDYELANMFVYDRNHPVSTPNLRSDLDEIGAKGEDILTNLLGGGHGTNLASGDGGPTGFADSRGNLRGTVFQP